MIEVTATHKIYNCKKCDFRSNSISGIASHTWVHRERKSNKANKDSQKTLPFEHKKGGRRCGKCNIGFANAREYNRHYRQHHLYKPHPDGRIGMWPGRAPQPQIPDYINIVKAAKEVAIITNRGGTLSTINRITNKIVHTLLHEK